MLTQEFIARRNDHGLGKFSNLEFGPSRRERGCNYRRTDPLVCVYKNFPRLPVSSAYMNILPELIASFAQQVDALPVNLLDVFERDDRVCSRWQRCPCHDLDTFVRPRDLSGIFSGSLRPGHMKLPDAIRDRLKPKSDAVQGNPVKWRHIAVRNDGCSKKPAQGLFSWQ